MNTEESLRAVLNTSPIIVLSKLNLIEDVVKLVFKEVEIPRGVLIELEKKRDEVYQKVIELVKKGLVKVEGVSKSLPRLGLGESSAILLALEKGKIIVLDDKRARRLARELGLRVIGTLSILKRLYRLGVLKMSPKTLYMRLIEMGFYIKKDVFDRIFHED